MLIKGALFAALYFTVDSVLERKNSWITWQVFVVVNYENERVLPALQGGRRGPKLHMELIYVAVGNGLIYSLPGVVLMGDISVIVTKFFRTNE